MNRFFFIIFFFIVCEGLTHSKVLSILIEQRDTILNGKIWGEAGAYEYIKGKVFFGHDPLLRQNQQIVDLKYASVNENGMVLSSGDIEILKPIDALQSKVALVEVSNRGGKFTSSYFLNGQGRVISPDEPDFFGDGLLLYQGVTIIWVGWQFDVPENEENLNFIAPIARYPEGSPIIGRVRSDWTVDEPVFNLDLGHNGQIGYPAYDPSAEHHVLTKRIGRNAQREIVDRSSWNFGQLVNDQVVDNPRSIYSRDGFEAGMIYELVYYSFDPPVVGLGLAAIRDIITYAKYDVESIFPVQYGIAAGVSQTGRFLRHFNYQGFNEDETGRRAYDGMMIITAGGGRGSFNHRFAQPSRDAHRYSAFFYPTDLFPFTGATQSDPETQKSDGIFAAYEIEHLPKIMSVNTGYEYWGRSASLIHTDPNGRQDIKPLENERIYHIASGQHFVNPIPSESFHPGVYIGNPLEFRPNYRALFLSLYDWVVAGTSPPPSNFPQISTGELVAPSQVHYPTIPDFIPATNPQEAHRVDYGPEWPQGIIDHQPPIVGTAFKSLVPQVDELGNEKSGIRNVEIRAPLASYIPYSLRQGLPGGNGEIADFRGTFILLPLSGKTKEDSRPAISDLYTGKADFMVNTRNHLTKLVEDRFILPLDIHRILERSSDYWNWIKPSEKNKDQVPITMMSFNIRYDNPGDGESQWDFRKNMVFEEIDSISPDFFGMQEALLHQCKDVEKGSQGFKWIGVGRDDGKEKGEFSPIFYNRRKWKLLDWNTFWLSETPEKPSRGWDAALERIVTWGQFKEKKTGTIVFVFNTHFDHRGVQARIESAKLIREKITEIGGKHRFILSGDFNVNPTTEAYLALTEPMPLKKTIYDSKLLSLSTPQGPRGTFSGFKVTKNLPVDQIDYIFCSDDFTVLNFSVVVKSDGKRYASDHFAVVATMQ